MPEEEDIDDAALDRKIMEEIKKEELDVDPNNIIIGKRRRRNKDDDFVAPEDLELAGEEKEGMDHFIAETRNMSGK